MSTDSIHTVLARRMRAARLRSGLSQSALGIAAGIDTGGAAVRINRYEQAVHFPDFLTATKIAAALHVPTAYLYCEDDELAQILISFCRASNTTQKAVFELLACATLQPESNKGRAKKGPGPL